MRNVPDVSYRLIKCDVTWIFVFSQAAHERHLEVIADLKQTRVPGKPQHFIDCYLDELDKVWKCCEPQ